MPCTTFTFKSSPDPPLAVRVRAPEWAAGPVTFRLNGRPLPITGEPGSYSVIEREWRKGDRLEATIPMAVRAEALRGATHQVNVYWTLTTPPAP